WKVFKGQNDAWLEEYRLYHRDENGRVVAENDDAISASRYGLMMSRHARVAGGEERFYRPLEYPSFGIVWCRTGRLTHLKKTHTGRGDAGERRLRHEDKTSCLGARFFIEIKARQNRPAR